MDIEFCWRAALAGYRLGFAPDAVIHYRWRSGLRPLAKQAFRWGEGEAHLYRDFRDRGLKRSGVRAALIDWAWSLVHVVDLAREPKFRGAWVRKTFNRAGRLIGSIRYRVLFL
jgi:GT2 family glycosyltransferase